MKRILEANSLMKSKEDTRQVRDEVVEKSKAGSGYEIYKIGYNLTELAKKNALSHNIPIKYNYVCDHNVTKVQGCEYLCKPLYPIMHFTSTSDSSSVDYKVRTQKVTSPY